MLQDSYTDLHVQFVMRGALHVYPPCLAQILTLGDIGAEVTVVCGACDPSVARLLRGRGINLIVVGDARVAKGILGKFESYLKFGVRASHALNQLSVGQTALWCGSADTAIALSRLLRRRQYIVNVLELYDQYPVYRAFLPPLLRRARVVVVPEWHRAWLMRCWWNLDPLPSVLPNKTYGHPRQRELDGTSTETRSAIDKIKGRKVLLYQGLLSDDRDLRHLARALSSHQSPLCLALMGPPQPRTVAALEALHPNTVYLGYIPAPFHLEVTSHAHIGVANYEGSSLNNVFCAPNKTFEYAGFGIPMLCNDVPGLAETVGRAGAGLCVDFRDGERLIRCLKEIDDNYESFSMAARGLFDSAEYEDCLLEVLDRFTAQATER